MASVLEMASANMRTDDDILVEVADDCVEDSQLDNLGRALKIGTSDINAAQEQNRHGVKSDGSRALLRRWYQGQLASEWKQKLINALKKANRKHVVEKCFPNTEIVDEPMRAAQPQPSRSATGSPSDRVDEHMKAGKTKLIRPARESLSGKWNNSKVKPVPRSRDPDRYMHYNMWNSLTKGYALIIGNDFIESINDRRPSAEKDIQNMTLLLDRLGYNFRNDDFIYKNCSSKEMDEALTKFVEFLTEEQGKKELQSAIVYISSHGDNIGVLGSDRVSLAIPDLLKKFNGILPGKPKVIIIDACWGDEDTHGSRVLSKNSGSPMTFLPSNADIFLIHATSHGKVSWSDNYSGSLLVEQLCEVFYATDRELEDLDTIMLRVTDELRKLDRSDTCEGLQSPTVIKQGVNKKLFFYPGYAK